ncbi:GH12 family glycosyl hydrolase domain-containing protein [Kutzneria sp. CA-103260]|uniref:GH12 family glycosyl hydrolase domain-containing protein n=1 Tax=Kutzneria sp. CA-103260 TaxID=2802641 RepID=UPI001BF1249E|nr:discoidin domain-containing protein [Kutzneria sp. CA-103260]QUQ62945.1 Glycosyl hydrolase family 12 [Kutzneria sp. CA-103260]
MLVPVATAHAATTTCEPQGSISANGGEYTIQANEWNSSDRQCITYNSGTSWSVSTANFNLSGGAPATYPSIYKGCHWGACTAGSGLPIQVSKLASATSSWNTTQPATGAYDVAYDLWTNSQATTGGQPDGSEIMIWLNSRGGVSPFGQKVASANIGGLNWDVWTGRQTSWNIVSYVLQGGGTAFNNLNVKALIDDSVARGVTNASHYLLDAEAGFEIWQGGQGLATNSFSFSATAGSGASVPLSQGKPVTASSVENASYPASNAVDGNPSTRWSSAFQDGQWIQVDLGSARQINQVALNWEAAYARQFRVQVSNDPSFATSTDLYATSAGTGGAQTLAVAGSGRYVRLLGQTRATPYGISLWEFQVFGS